MSKEISLVAYQYRESPVDLIPAKTARKWMLAMPKAVANRCTPMHVANQSGWWIVAKAKTELFWNGGLGPECVSIKIDDTDQVEPRYVDNHFGNGIVSFLVPYIFRTPPGVDLLVRGPANLPKDGASALEGLVESDWLPVPLTVNWKITRPGKRVVFNAGEPLAMIVPQQRGFLENFVPTIEWASAEPHLVEANEQYSLRRNAIEAQIMTCPMEEVGRGSRPIENEAQWGNQYVKGVFDGWPTRRKPKLKLQLKEFEDTRLGPMPEIETII